MLDSNYLSYLEVKSPFCGGNPTHPLLHTPLSRPDVANLHRESFMHVCSTKKKKLSRRGVYRKPSTFVPGLCRGRAPQARYKVTALDAQPFGLLHRSNNPQKLSPHPNANNISRLCKPPAPNFGTEVYARRNLWGLVWRGGG